MGTPLTWTVGPALTVGVLLDVPVIPTIASQQPEFQPKGGMTCSARHCAGLANTNSKYAGFAAVCLHADLLQEMEQSGPDTKGLMKL